MIRKFTNMTMMLLAASALLVVLPMQAPADTTTDAVASNSRNNETLQDTVDYLIATVAGSDLILVRNGKEHTPTDAAEHLQRKYDHFRNKIKTPEDFIRLAASKSLISGKPYTIRFPDGEVRRCDAWLTGLLAERRTGVTAAIAK